MHADTIPLLIDRLRYRCSALLVDAVTEHVPGERVVAVKNITVNEDFFQGHFPGTPLMPGVLMIETLAQVSACLLLHRADLRPTSRVTLRGVNDAKFRRQVIPGDRLRVEVSRRKVRGPVALVHGAAYVGEQLVAEADLLMAIEPDPTSIAPSAVVSPGARIGDGSSLAQNVFIGPNVRIGKRCRIGASTVIDGWTEARLADAAAAQKREAEALDQEIEAAHKAEAEAETQADEAASQDAAAASRMESLRAALAAIETQRRADEAKAREERLRAERQKQMAEAQAAHEREAVAARPTGAGTISSGSGPHGQLQPPVIGVVVKGWGEQTDAGPATGLSYHAPPGAHVIPRAGGVWYSPRVSGVMGCC